MQILNILCFSITKLSTSLPDVEPPAADGNNVKGSGHSSPYIWSLNLMKVKAEEI